MTTHPGTHLRSLMDSTTVAAPGAFNALVARAITQAGFDAAYISGGAASVAAGVPDVGLLTLEHFTRLIREVADASGLPVMADADTGFGEAEMTRRTVIEYHRAGAAGLHLEDQVFPKRCGHLDGKALVPTDHMVEKIQWAAKASRDCSDGAFIICARTDARGVEGMDAAIKRARAYVEAGADMIFPEGLQSEAEFAQFAQALRSPASTSPERKLGSPDQWGEHLARPDFDSPSGSPSGSPSDSSSGSPSRAPREGAGGMAPSPTSPPSTPPPTPSPYLLANMTEFGKTPLIPLPRFADLGYNLVIYPVTMLRIAMGAVTRALETLKNEGTIQQHLPEMQSRQDLYTLINYTPSTPWEFPC